MKRLSLRPFPFSLLGLLLGLLTLGVVGHAQDFPHDAASGGGCLECHSSHSSGGDDFHSVAGNTNLCLSCHIKGGLAGFDKHFFRADQAEIGRAGTSHRWDSKGLIYSEWQARKGSTGSVHPSGWVNASTVVYYDITITTGGDAGTAEFSWSSSLLTSGAGVTGASVHLEASVWVGFEDASPVVTPSFVTGSKLRVSVHPLVCTDPIVANKLLEGSVACSTCHDQHYQIFGKPFLRVSNRDSALCVSCHGDRDKRLYSQGPENVGSHPVGIVYATPDARLVDSPGLPLDDAGTPADASDDTVACLTCHAVHFADSDTDGDPSSLGTGDGFLLRMKNDATLCQACHTYPDHNGMTCTDCHQAHPLDSGNVFLVQGWIHDTSITFVDRDASDQLTDYIKSNHPSPSYDGVCEVCHTTTNYHRNNPSGGHDHNKGVKCTVCHLHQDGFAPSGGSCTDCHAAPQDNGDGVPAQGRRAVMNEFPVADSHAHYGAELDDSACVVCHDMTTHMDGYVDLIDPDTSALYSFVQMEDLASDPDLSDFCAACHDSDGAARLPSPMDPFGNGNPPTEVASRFQGTLQWNEWYGDTCFGEEGTQRGVNSHHDISDADQAFSGAKLECLNCHGAHTASASQTVVDPNNPKSPWTGTSNDFCLACHHGGTGPSDPGFPAGVVGPTVALRGLESCGYSYTAPWWVNYTWSNTPHGPGSKRGWAGYSGAPGAELDCVVCHDPHGSYSPTHPEGNPYMIRDFVDGTPFIDDGVRPGAQWTGPPWTTTGIAREVVISVTGTQVDWGGPTGLCNVCHADWLNAYSWHATCNGCQTCHGHGQDWDNNDWGPSPSDSQPCPSGKQRKLLMDSLPIPLAPAPDGYEGETELPVHFTSPR